MTSPARVQTSRSTCGDTVNETRPKVISSLVRIAACALVITFSVSCDDGESVPRSVRLILNTDVDIPDVLDRVEVTYTASKTYEGLTCVPVAQHWDLTSQDDLPIIIDFFPGEVYDVWLGIDVAWLRRGEVIIRRELMVAWPESPAIEELVDIELGCIERECEPWHDCVSGACIGNEPASQLPGPFNPSLRDSAGESCDGSAISGSDGDADIDGDTDLEGETETDSGVDADRDGDSDGAADGDSDADADNDNDGDA